ncbi:MAG TPA: XrtA system polysaccharide deacetylase [Candidatus Angelobacter sp.]|nr:XrtA system polysaccharide deacetylase [Candidatus Angelobacter sp.]
MTRSAHISEPQACAATAIPPAHVLSVDVEDYFQVEAFAGQVSRESWERWPSRVVENTQRVLDLFDAHQAKATFFFVGWVAARFPNLVREAQARGHEIACHSYWHRTIYSLTPDEFREDTQRAKRVIEDACGSAVQGYRAPSWSITRDCLWALDILAEEGFTYDSSIYPIHHDLYGVPGARRTPYTHGCARGLELREFPPATLRFAGTNFPVAGGGYLRIFPAWYTELAFRKFESMGERLVVYLHPWELDPEQPRIRGPLKSRLRHYTNLRGMKSRVEKILERHKFVRFCDVMAQERQGPALRGDPAAEDLTAGSEIAVGQSTGDQR